MYHMTTCHMTDHMTGEDSDGEEEDPVNTTGSMTMIRRTSTSSAESGYNQTEGSTPEPRFMRQMSEQDRMRNRFSKKQGKGTIDVWWLFDDGGK